MRNVSPPAVLVHSCSNHLQTLFGGPRHIACALVRYCASQSPATKALNFCLCQFFEIQKSPMWRSFLCTVSYKKNFFNFLPFIWGSNPTCWWGGDGHCMPLTPVAPAVTAAGAAAPATVAPTATCYACLYHPLCLFQPPGTHPYPTLLLHPLTLVHWYTCSGMNLQNER